MYESTVEDKELIKDVLANFHQTFGNMFFCEDTMIDYPGISKDASLSQDEKDLLFAITYICLVNPKYKSVIKRFSDG